MLEAILFYWFALLTLAGAILTVTRRSPVLAAVWLAVSLLGVAGLFLLLGAEFLFAAQIIVYIGGITLLFLFVIMLVNLEAAARVRQFRRGGPVVAVAGLGLAIELILLLKRGSDLNAPFLNPPSPNPSSPSNPLLLSDDLLANHQVSFEVISVLLLVAIIGSVWMGQQRKQPPQNGSST